MQTGEVQIRVRYQETDQMGVVYHANYFTYFEIGRTELSRTNGFAYKDIEASGVLAAVIKAECSYHKPAKYDDLLTIKTALKRITRVKIEYEHQIFRDSELLVTGHITLAFIDRQGKIQAVPDWLTQTNSGAASTPIPSGGGETIRRSAIE